jgi:hypothetical protein
MAKQGQKKNDLSIVSLKFLKKLQKASLKTRKAVIRQANPRQLKLLSECCLGVLKNQFPITPKRENSMKKYKRTLLGITSHAVPCDKRKRMLVRQAGGFLSGLLATAIPVVASLVGEHLLSKK